MNVVKEFIRVKATLGKKPLQDLLHLPEMTDQKILFALKLMDSAAMHTLILGDSYKETYVAICLWMFRLTLKYGLSALYSPAVFVLWGSIHSILGQFDASFEAEQLSFDVVDTTHPGTQETRCYWSNKRFMNRTALVGTKLFEAI